MISDTVPRNLSKLAAPAYDSSAVNIEPHCAALIAPVTTSPESKPMPTNMLGTKKVSVREMAYPGSKIHQMEMPYKIRTIDRAMARPTPKDMADSRSFGKPPLV